jgi:hypothetical protein
MQNEMSGVLSNHLPAFNHNHIKQNRVWKKRIEDIEYTATIFNNSVMWESLSQIRGCWDEYYKHCLSLEDDMQNLSDADFSRTVCYTSKCWLLITVDRFHLTISPRYFIELCYCVSDHLIHLPDCSRFRYMNFSSAFLCDYEKLFLAVIEELKLQSIWVQWLRKYLDLTDVKQVGFL